jgi:antitoxin component YwqK of YwqJK toxin-antitoxin module
MKRFFFAFICFTSLSASAQYYYKDIIGTNETAETMKLYQQHKVNRVVLNSYDGDGTKSDAFYVEQTFLPQSNILRTITRSGVTTESVLTTYINANGKVAKTVDSTSGLVSTSVYNYNADGSLQSVLQSSIDSANAFSQFEDHIWQYENGKVSRLLRIKNKKDTITLAFKLDEDGNIAEETSIRNGIASEPVYYYYDDQNRLTDIVRYNNKVKKLLPEYMFEYSPTNQVLQRITVPSNSSEYTIWRFQYDKRGLKIREAIYNKQKQLNGKIEYIYSFGS